MISEKKIKSYKEKGYLIIDNAIPFETLKKLQSVTDEFLEKSKTKIENDEIYDISPDHTKDNPKLRRLKNPHQIHQVYEDITKDNQILSNKIANAKISYGGKGPLAEANEEGWLIRFFNSGWWPF